MGDNSTYKKCLDSLLGALNDVIIFLSPESIIQEISPLASNYFSWQLSDIQGKSFESLYQIPKILTPFPQADFLKIRDQNAVINNVLYVNNKKIHFSWSAITIDPLVGYMLIGRDTSDIKKLDIQKQTIYSQLAKISLCVPGNFYWKNTNEQYLGCNDTLLKTLGLNSMVDIIGKTDWDLWPEQAEKLRENDQRVIQTGATLFLEETVAMPGQGDRYFTAIKMPLLDEEGNIIGILGNSLDITELKNTQKELQIAKEKAEAASRVKTEFIANMGHDIRTPLSGIIGFSEFLERHAFDIEEKDCAKQIHDSGEQLLNLLNGVLDIITADSTNENTIVKDVFDLHEVFSDVLKLERPAVEVQHLKIEEHVDANIPHMLIGDKIKLHRILLNLTGNAIKFTKKGRIALNAKLISERKKTISIRFEVTDTGIGIPLELQDKVFDRFFKVSPSHQGLYTGNGIGLHIAQKYVELLGGALQLKSKEGVGTTFYFTLKFALAPSNTKLPKDKVNLKKSLPTNLPQPTSSRQKRHVLVIEDNTPALIILKKMLASYNVEVNTANDAESAWSLIQKQSFDLIITDIGLPQKNGIELTTLIRKHEKKQKLTSTVIIGLTGHSHGEITQKCLNAGMNKVYQKPMRQELLDALFKEIGIEVKKSNNRVTSFSNEMKNKDLPKTKEELFEINQFPIFDFSTALNILGSEQLVQQVIESLHASLQPDVILIKNAYDKTDWKAIEKLAHKMKSGALYGTIRLHYALLYLEQYLKTGHVELADKLYMQSLVVIEDTLKYLARYQQIGN